MSHSPPSIRCLVFDFDGTLTDAEGNAERFHQASREALAAALRVPLADLERDWRAQAARLAAESPETGFVVAGHTVAPANADPYLTANTIGLRLAALAGCCGDDSKAQAHLVSEVHLAAYASAPAPLRTEAAEVLDALIARGVQVRIVSNSDGAAIERRLDSSGLRTRGALRVHGHARKFLVEEPVARDARFDALPVATAAPGLRRPLLLRRGRYFEALREIWETCDASPETTLVCGDIFELDLALPAALGARIQLLTSRLTLPHELAAARAHPRAGTSTRLSGLLERL